MLFVLLQFRGVIQINHNAVNPGANEPVTQQLLENVQMLTLALGDYWRQHHDPAAFWQRQNLVHHLAHGLSVQCQIVGRTAWLTHPGKQQPEIVVDFGNGANGGARVVAG